MREPTIVQLGRVASTQDSALELNLQPGDACVSFEQVSGRGRRGNTWNGEGGVAVTVVLDKPKESLPIAVAATLAAQLNNVIPEVSVGIKWPNDLLVGQKKLAGILIEHKEDVFLVGVGVNVLHSPIASATCLADNAFVGKRGEIALLVVSSILDAAQLSQMQAVTQWRKRDILVGTTQHVQSGDNCVEGVVLDIDPCQNLILQTSLGLLTLPAETSTIVTTCQ